MDELVFPLTCPCLDISHCRVAAELRVWLIGGHKLLHLSADSRPRQHRVEPTQDLHRLIDRKEVDSRPDAGLEVDRDLLT